MAWKAYNTVNGQILGETSTSGSAPLDYQLDALGSVVGTIKTNGTLENTYRYAGYGQQVSKTGTAPDPKFLWVGGWGYRLSNGLIYVRRRHLVPQSTWTSVDPHWPGEEAFGYATQRPTLLADPTGEYIWSPPGCNHSASSCCTRIGNIFADDGAKTKYADCMKSHGLGMYADLVLDFYRRGCYSLDMKVCSYCSGGNFSNAPFGCLDPCKIGAAGIAIYSIVRGIPLVNTDPVNNPDGTNTRCDTLFANACSGPSRDGCQCAITLCEDNIVVSTFVRDPYRSFCLTVFHEMTHCLGAGHASGGTPPDLVYLAAQCCLCKAWAKPGDDCSGYCSTR